MITIEPLNPRITPPPPTQVPRATSEANRQLVTTGQRRGPAPSAATTSSLLLRGRQSHLKESRQASVRPSGGAASDEGDTIGRYKHKTRSRVVAQPSFLFYLSLWWLPFGPFSCQTSVQKSMRVCVCECGKVNVEAGGSFVQDVH